MSERYEDAFQQVLEAVRRGEPLDAAIGRFPEHATALRDDIGLADRLAALSNASPEPRSQARWEAHTRMQAQMSAERAREPRQAAVLRGLGWPRFAIALAVVAMALIGAGLVLTGGESTVEAATIEGVVVDNQGGTLTVQTLQSLERVEVPADALVSDGEGGSIGLNGIEVGQVVVVDLERRGREAIAQRIERFVDSIEAWCSGEPRKCAALSIGLELTQRRCQSKECPIGLDRLEALRLRAGDSVDLEQLREDCRGSDAGACERLVTFCREHAAVCAHLTPPQSPEVDRAAPGERLRQLQASCLQGDETACRQLARACELFPAICPVDFPDMDGSPRAPEAVDTPAVERPVAPRP